MQRIESPLVLYINLSSSATSSSTELSIDPVASFSESRNQSILEDVGQYSMAIVRAALQGQRNFPLLIASIVPGQSDPFLTVYKLRLTLAIGVPLTYVAPNWQTISRRLVVRVFDGSDKQVEVATITIKDPAGVYPGPLSTAADVATATTARFALQSPSIPFIRALVVTAVAVGGNDTLVFTPGAPPVGATWPSGYYFSVEPSGESTADEFWGFAGPTSVEYSTGPEPLTMPFPCSYNPNSGYSNVFDSGIISLEWESQVSGTPAPRTPIPAQDDGDTSYWMYDYSWWSYLYNKTLQRAYDAIVIQATTAGVELQLECPFVYYEPSTRSFVLNTTPASVAGPTWGGRETLGMWQNEELANMMAYPGTYDLRGDQTIIWNSARLSPSESYLQLRPDYPATANGWSPVGSIVFMAGGGWGMRQEVMSAPRLYGLSSSGDVSGSNSNSSNDTAQIMSDVIPAVSDGSDYNAYQIIYAPNVIREVELTAKGLPLRDLDFSVAWRNAKTGRLLPVTLNPSASMSVKIMLRRKR